MLFTTCFLAVFLTPASAFYGSPLVNRAIEKAHNIINIPKLITFEFALPVNRPAHKICELCVEFSDWHIMRETIKHIDHECDITTCPYLKHICEMGKKFPMVSLGYLLAKIKPWKQSYAYCYGAKFCPHLGAAEDDNMVPLNINNKLCVDNGQDVSVLMHSDSQPLNVLEKIEYTNKLESSHSCHDCIEYIAHEVMEDVVIHIKETCKKTESPCAKKACQWAHDHPRIALGYLIAVVRPGEWGSGYCFGREVCHEKKETNFDYEVLADDISLLL